MINYDKLWETMRKKNISQYNLIHRYRISTGQLDRLRKNAPINTTTLNTLCLILDCELSDIVTFEKSTEETL